MRKLIKIIVGLVILLIIAVVAIPFFIPLEQYKAQIAQQVKAATGRDLVIGGKISASIFPSIAVDVAQVSLSAPEGFASKQMLQADDITVDVSLSALLKKRLEVKRFILKHPVINLEVNAAGVKSWEFTPPSAAAPAPAATPAADADDKPKGNFLAGLMLGDVKIENGEVHFRDFKGKKTYDVTAINAKAALPSITQPLNASGDMVWNGEKVLLNMGVDNPQAFLDGKAVACKVDVRSTPINVAYEGNASTSGASGLATLNIASLPKLAKWTGSPFAWKGTAPLAFSVKGDLAASTVAVQLSNADIALDDVKLKGVIKAGFATPVPAIEAKLAAESLDFNPYLAKQASNGFFISDAVAMEPWSTDKIDLSALRAANANLSITTNSLLVQKIKLGKTVLNVLLNNGALKVSVPEAALYGGKATSTVTLDTTGALSKQFDIAGVKAGDFLKDAMDSDRFSGTLNASGTITGKLLSQSELMKSLGGSGKVELTDGSVKGVDLASMIRNVQSAFKDTDTSSQKTDFSEMGGTFTIASGIVTNKDLSMKAPLLRLTGTGTVDLPQQQINYRLVPTIVATAQGQGGKDKAGLDVPINVTGPLDHPRFTPDLAGVVNNLLQNPDALKDTVKSVKDQLKSGSGSTNSLKGLLKGLTKQPAQ